jgi:hypothetical protein
MRFLNGPDQVAEQRHLIGNYQSMVKLTTATVLPLAHMLSLNARAEDIWRR